MILDERAEFCDATALNTGGAGSYLIGDVIDLGAAPTTQDLNGGADTPLYLVITVDTAVTSGGAGTYQFHLASDAQAAIADDGTATYHFSTAAIAKATLIAGYRVCAVALPSGVYERYLGILQTTAVAAATAGKINAFLTANPGKWLALPQATGAD
jgi:hypothetical protein